MKKLNKIIELYNVCVEENLVHFQVRLLDESIRGEGHFYTLKNGTRIVSKAYPEYDSTHNIIYIEGISEVPKYNTISVPFSVFTVLESELKNKITKEVL